MHFHWIIFIVCGFCSLRCYGDYTCLCNYNVEIPVYANPDLAAGVIGYMYEFDCKNILSEKDPEWPSIEFEHQIGFVKTNGQIRIQTCPGSVPIADRIVSTTHTTMTSTVKSSPTTFTTTSLSTVPHSTSSSTFPTTSSSTLHSTTNSRSFTPKQSTSTLSPTTILSSTTALTPIKDSSSTAFFTSTTSTAPLTLPPTHTFGQTTITTSSRDTTLPTRSTVQSEINLSTTTFTSIGTGLSSNPTFPSKATLLTTSVLQYLTTLPSFSLLTSERNLSSTSILPPKTSLSPFTTLPSKATLDHISTSLSKTIVSSSNLPSKVTVNGQSTSQGQSVTSHEQLSTNKSPSASKTRVNTVTYTKTSPPTSASTLLKLFTTFRPYLSSKLTTEISYWTIPVSTNRVSISTNHSSSFKTLPQTDSHSSLLSGFSTLTLSTSNEVSQSSQKRNTLSTILSTLENTTTTKSTTKNKFILTSTSQTSSNSFSINFTNSSSNFPNISTTTQILASTNRTGLLKTTQSTQAPVTSSNTSNHSGSSYKPIISDRVDLCPYKNLAMSVYNRTTFTYPLFRQYGNYCYELRLNLGNWFEAQQDCVSRDGELAVIENEEVQARVFDLASSTQYKVDVWIGLHDMYQEGNWEWVNGAKITRSSYNQGILINPALTDSEDCVLMDAKSGVWKNTACKSILFDIQSYPWVCQYKMT